ncbi:MAG: 3-dehydroquinate synthase [Candidatus Omnitrophota bacterium]
MRNIRVNLKERSYNIRIGRGILSSLGIYLKRLHIGRDCYIITNARLKKKYSKSLDHPLTHSSFSLRYRLIPDSEKSKSLKSAYAILKDLAVFDKKKNIFILSFGGGVIGDLSGFVASIYRRGIPYVQIPTTLLAQVDSSIGGKTAVDMSAAKNLVGAIYQPKGVITDTSLLKTLSQRQIRSGLAEIIKYAVIKDSLLFDYLEKNNNSLLSLKSPGLEFVIGRCVKIKAGIIEKDEFEKKGIRTILNFGHTIGHAIETAGGYSRYNHGEAISLGMLVAMDISQMLGLTCKSTVSKIEALIQKIGLPYRIEKLKANAIINAHYHDKKFQGSKNRFVLVKDIGKVMVVENVPLPVIRKAIKNRF